MKLIQATFALACLSSLALGQAPATRCLTPGLDPARMLAMPPSDCGYSSTNPAAQYAPDEVFEIPVVFHVIQRNSGEGFISQAQLEAQINILNEDFRALQGSLGANGLDTKIQFALATLDPSGQPATGITYSTNNQWFGDSGGYWNSLAWDTSRYMNVYTNDGGGALGYVPDIPQGGLAGLPRDRIVVLWSSIGRNGPIGPPFDQGRTLTHEVGHYLGLLHTFDGSCSGGSCNSSGDLICDTNAESQPNDGCSPGSSSCGSSDPVRNYMNYSDDTCMWEFTEEQARRMRCTLEFYRPNVYDVIDESAPTFCDGSDGALGSCPCANGGTPVSGCDNTGSTGGVQAAVTAFNPGLFQAAITCTGFPATGAPTAILLRGTSLLGAPIVFGDGLRCVDVPVVRLAASTASGGTSVHTFGHGVGGGDYHYQAWYRSTPAMYCTPGAFNTSNGVTLSW
jgi:hypothetical protein